MIERFPTPGRSTRHDDEYVKTARNFALRFRNATEEFDRERLWIEQPGFFYAFDFHQRIDDDPEAVMYLQARLLARQPIPDIADAMGIHPDAITWYEAMFFNVVDKLNHRDWITKQVLMPALMRHQTVDDSGQPSPFKDSTVARPFLDGTLKLFAYFGGVHLVDVLIAGMQAGKPVLSPDDVGSWFDEQWGLTIRRRSSQAAMQFEINKYNAMELFSVHAQIVALDRSDETRDQARTTIERHIQTMVEEIPWAVGSDGEKVYRTKALGRLDNMAAELRDDEVLSIAAGEPVEGLKDDFPLALPPRRKNPSKVIGQDVEL